MIHTWDAQLSQPPHALQYEEALRAAGVTSLDPVLKEMATGDRPALGGGGLHHAWKDARHDPGC